MIKFEEIKIKYKEDLLLFAEKFEIKKGEKIFLTGSSGQGKTLFLRYLGGFLDFFPELKKEGLVFLKDEKKDYQTYCDNNFDSFYIGQDAENFVTGVFCEDELITFCQGEDYNVCAMKASKFIADNKPFFKDKKISTLSHGELQELLFFTAFLSQKNLILLDEPFARLDKYEREKVSRFIDSMVEKGKTVIVAGHGIELFHLDFDRLFELKDSKISKIVKKDISKRFFDLRSKSRELKEIVSDETTLIEAKEIEYFYEDKNLFNDLDLEIKKGEIIAFSGINGCGKTTLGKIVAGEIKPKTGKLINNGAKVIFTGSFPDYHFLYGNLFEEISFMDKEKKETFLNNLDFQIEDKYHTQLSFGQKMRFLIYMYASIDYDVYIFDEIFSGQDMENIYNLMLLFNELKRSGKSIIVITQDTLISRMIADKTINVEDFK